MKKLFLIIIGLCLCTALYADMNTYIIGAVSAGGDCDTPVYSNTTAGSADYDINDAVSYKYIGNRFTPTTSPTICKATFYVSYRAGDISGKTFRAYLCTLSGANLNVMTEADSTVTGSNDWSDASNSTGTPISFTWAAGYAMTAETQYAIVITMGATDTEDSDASNYAELEYSTETEFPSGVVSIWNHEKTNIAGTPGSQAKIILYSE